MAEDDQHRGQSRGTCDQGVLYCPANGRYSNTTVPIRMDAKQEYSIIPPVFHQLEGAWGFILYLFNPTKSVQIIFTCSFSLKYMDR